MKNYIPCRSASVMASVRLLIEIIYKSINIVKSLNIVKVSIKYILYQKVFRHCATSMKAYLQRVSAWIFFN